MGESLPHSTPSGETFLAPNKVYTRNEVNWERCASVIDVEEPCLNIERPSPRYAATLSLERHPKWRGAAATWAVSTTAGPLATGANRRGCVQGTASDGTIA
jgi:hypothetical protein